MLTVDVVVLTSATFPNDFSLQRFSGSLVARIILPAESQ